MTTQTDTTLAGWVDAARAMGTERYAALAHNVSKGSRGNDEVEADALPRAALLYMGRRIVRWEGPATREGVAPMGPEWDPARDRRIMRRACVVAVKNARRDLARREAYRDALPLTPDMDVPEDTATRPATWEDIAPTLRPSDRAVLAALAADALTTRTAWAHPDAPRRLPVKVIALALGGKAPRKAAESAALRAGGCLAWAHASLALTPRRMVRYVGPETSTGRVPMGPETLTMRADRALSYVTRSKGTHLRSGAPVRRPQLKASRRNVFSVPLWEGAFSDAFTAVDGYEARRLQGPATSDGRLPMAPGGPVRSLGYRPVAATKYAPNPAPRMRGAGEGVPVGLAGGVGLSQRPSVRDVAALASHGTFVPWGDGMPAMSTVSAVRDARKASAAVDADADAVTADANAPAILAVNAPRPLWARGEGTWVPASSAPILTMPTWGVGGSHVRGTWADAMGPRDPGEAPVPERDASPLRPCARPTPEGGCGCGARKAGTPLTASGEHHLVPCETPREGRCGCGRKAGALTLQEGVWCHLPRVRRK